MAEQASIFVADDDPDLRTLVSDSFRQKGFLVREAHNGSELLELLERARKSRSLPSLVLSDLHMPGASGLDVLRWLRQWLPHVPAVIMTAYADGHTMRRALKLGAAKVLHKPLDVRRFVERFPRPSNHG